MLTSLRLLTALVLVLYPIAWFAPLIRAGLLPIFGLSEISVVTGLQALWETDYFLTVAVALFAIVAPIAKTFALLMVQFRMADPKLLPATAFLGRLAMADVFLVAVYVTVFKSMSYGRIEAGWGLYLFTFCVLGGIVVSYLTERVVARDGLPSESQTGTS
ncbi:paraquat-inducible protein A [Chachezhania antarctica]|uniref:paraquat-inducible protein A n=1 Tax=Chachezhania antarctica TaxID=2340860 RepID=UPI000EB2D0E4|nr:paraquat-inducible protein A [Chachezhania antarctica]|tara:strand:+ start:1913 stop:2392 length:480 start_codon:yes stop_codon:yes gene_type:complete